MKPITNTQEMSSYTQIIKDERYICRLSVHKERFRNKSFEGQFEEFGLIDAFVIPSNDYMGSTPLWWDDSGLKQIMNINDAERVVHRITVSTKWPLIHTWTYEDFRKRLCERDDIGEIERLPSGEPRIYDRISFLQREIIDNETHRWEGRDADIESTFRSVCRWCFHSI